MTMVRPESCTDPADGSSVRVEAEEPGSRPRVYEETYAFEWGDESREGESEEAGRNIK